MLIRSQDKTLLLNLDSTIGIAINDNTIATAINGNIVTMAVYKTEEKAISVLDDLIQEYYKCNCTQIIGNGAAGFIRNRVFQMPLESEAAE